MCGGGLMAGANSVGCAGASAAGSGFRSTSTSDGITGFGCGDLTACTQAGVGFLDFLWACFCCHQSPPRPPTMASNSSTASKSPTLLRRLDEAVSKFGTRPFSQNWWPNPSGNNPNPETWPRFKVLPQVETPLAVAIAFGVRWLQHRFRAGQVFVGL